MPSKKIQFPISLTERYINAQYIESGAFGSVFKVHDQILQKDVAIKVLPKSASESQIIRFQQEAKATSKLDHPNIVQIYNFDVNESGDVFMVIELIEGQSLKSFIENKRHIDIAFSIGIFQQICIGMHHAHKNNVLHRDLKPGNILLTQDESSNYLLKIIDFGIAKVLDFGVELTTGNIAIGTPAYMSPEQGAGEEVDKRSDIYSFGCIMHEFLSGNKLYEAETPLELIYKHAKDEIPELSKTFEGEQIPEQLVDVICKCLAKDKEDRYSSFLQVEEALDTVLEELEKASRKAPSQVDYPVETSKKKGFLALNPILVLGIVIASVSISTLALPLIVNPTKEVKKENHPKPNVVTKVEPEAPILPLNEKYKKYSTLKLLKKAKEYSKKKGGTLRAISILNELNKREPENLLVYEYLGRCYLDAEYNNKCKEYLSIIKKKAPNSINYLRLKGYVNFASSDYDKAIIAYTKVLEKNTKDFKSRENRMASYHALDQYENAIADASILIEANHNSYHNRKLRAQSFAQAKMYKESLSDYAVLINLKLKKEPFENDVLAELYFKRAEVLYQLDNYKNVVADCTKAIKLYSKSKYKILELRAMAYDKTGQTKKAILDRKKIKQLNRGVL